MSKAHLCSGGKDSKRWVTGDRGKAKEANSDQGQRDGSQSTSGGKEILLPSQRREQGSNRGGEGTS